MIAEPRLIRGDCLPELRAMPDASVDALVTDPPAGISFMGVAWDTYRENGKPRASSMHGVQVDS
jgi:DNA modification methylase